ncbi:uncharacterized protein LOC125244787 isoform X3 [Megalobrama amblycephala]|uniref:uncharacterized protein LOC125244787 isoform X3 n=1 Tax=Megalobrama amblycephala TaxID=75352 RepID=UPI00201444BD|nr:uncharacterized protein LOC125244787 isoform X3 [Megalobrama amblycephala]
MNWVGGSRSRYVKNKEDSIKQRAFFQKQRMKRKSNIMDSTQGQNSGNMDLLTLFIVNQIASKKEQTGKPKINRLIGAKRTKKALNEPLELPMSPCSPSKLNLVTSQPQYSADTPGFKIRKHCLSEEFKFMPARMTRMLSPVLESNLSDVSGSENQQQPSSTSADSSDPIQPKPTPHVPSPLPSRDNPDNMKKNTPQDVSFAQPTKLNNPWKVEQDPPHNSSVVGIRFESTLPNPEMGEHSVTSVLYPLSSEQPEEPLFIDFKGIDCEVLASMSSCDRSQNMDNDGHFSTQEFASTDCNTSGADGINVFGHVCESPRRVHLGPEDEEKIDLCHAEDSFIAKHCCLSVNNLTATPSQAPSCKHEATSYCDCQSEVKSRVSDSLSQVNLGQRHKENQFAPSNLQTKALRHDGNPPITLDAGTQTDALSYCDVSVQCLLIHPSNSVSFPTVDHKTNVLTTGRLSSNFNQMLKPTTLSSPKDGHKRTGNRPSEASATNQQAPRHTKSQTGISFRKLRSQKSTKRDLASVRQ